MFRVIALAAVAAVSAFAQIPEPPEVGVGMGHLHLRVSEAEFEEHTRLLVEGLGARPASLGAFQTYLIPGVVIVVSRGSWEGGSVGTTVDHIGFYVEDLAAAEAKWKAAGGKMLPDKPTPSQSYVELPGGVKVELSEDPSLDVPIRNHHMHFYTQSDRATQAWYIKMFGVEAGTRGPFQTGNLRGGELTFAVTEDEFVGTKGRGVDHIGFEVKNLEQFCKDLEAKGVTFDRPYKKVEQMGLAFAFLTDPWGGYIELTEGLTQLK